VGDDPKKGPPILTLAIIWLERLDLPLPNLCNARISEALTIQKGLCPLPHASTSKQAQTRITMAAPSHRHQSSLEDIIDFSEAHPIFESSQQRAQAVDRFHRIVAQSENVEQPASSRYGNGYNRPALVRLTFEYARSPESQDKFLKAFFQSLGLGMLDDSDGIDLDDQLASFRESVFSFADHLIYHFFLPCMISLQPQVPLALFLRFING